MTSPHITNSESEQSVACPCCGVAIRLGKLYVDLYAENVRLKRELEWEYLTPGMKLAAWLEHWWKKWRSA